MTVIIVLTFKMINYVHCDSNNNQAAEAAPERAPLILNKDDDSSSLGSSYDSVSTDGNDIEEPLDLSQNGPDNSRWSEGYDPHHLCTICLDAAKDCFFLPCGHCATCFTCGTRCVLPDALLIFRILLSLHTFPWYLDTDLYSTPVDIDFPLLCYPVGS